MCLQSHDRGHREHTGVPLGEYGGGGDGSGGGNAEAPLPDLSGTPLPADDEGGKAKMEFKDGSGGE